MATIKELSIEEKAKRYDEAKKKAKVLKECSTNTEVVRYMDELFSELAESEDERIRKALINYYSFDKDGGSHALDNITPKQIVAWLEKQGEQKPTDKIEPKLKVGDWCIDNEDGTIFQIVKVLDNTYTYKTNEGKEYYCSHYSLENDARLWTIQDAKDGDVLTCYSDIKGQPIEQTGIIKQYVGRHGGCSNSFKAHFGVNWDNNVVIEGYMGSSNIYPATKEQRDTLERAMNNAGYTFDFEKKELKKIVDKEQIKENLQDNSFRRMFEQKPAEWEPQTGDTFRKKGTTSPTYHLCDKREYGITFGFVENREVGISGGEITLFALKQDYELVERPKSIEDVVEEELNKDCINN